MNFVNEFGEKQNGFAEVVAFCHVMCRYFDRFLLQGVDKNWRQACLFYLALGLICEGYWQVNSRRPIFRIADPSYDVYMHPQRTNIPLQGLDRRALTVGAISGPHSQLGALLWRHFTSRGFTWSAKSIQGKQTSRH